MGQLGHWVAMVVVSWGSRLGGQSTNYGCNLILSEYPLVPCALSNGFRRARSVDDCFPLRKSTERTVKKVGEMASLGRL